MEHRIVVAGFGGQGVLLIGQVLCYAGMAEGKNVSWLPSYGPEMRGRHRQLQRHRLRWRDRQPLVTEPEKLIVMNLPSFSKYEPLVEKGGTIYVNSSLIELKSEREDIQKRYVPCNEAAIAVGNGRAANMAMLGAFLADTGVVSLDSAMKALAKIFGERRAHLLPSTRRP